MRLKLDSQNFSYEKKDTPITHACTHTHTHTHTGAPISFMLMVQSARDFPVDVYFLMDLSFSMRDDLENLKRLGSSVGRFE